MMHMHFFISELRKHSIVLLMIVLLGLVLRLYFSKGFTGFDDGEYARFAYQMANGQFAIEDYAGPPVFPLRLGVIFPTSLAFRFFGLSESSMVIYPLVLSIMGLLLSYICASGLFNHRIGLIAAGLYAIAPVEIVNATQLLPDLPAMFFASLGIVVILFFIQSDVKSKPILFLSGMFAGLAFGFSWLCKESVSFYALTCGVLMVLNLKRTGKSGVVLWAGVASGSLLILIGEMVVYENVMGDLLFRFHEIERNYRELQKWFFTEGSDFGWSEGSSRVTALIKRLFIKGPEFILMNSFFLFLPLLGTIACIHALYWKDRTFLLPAVWLITLFLMLNFSSSSIISYMPLPLFDRYFYPIVFPSIILAAGFLGKLIFHEKSTSQDDIGKERYFWGIVLACFLALTGGAQVYWTAKTPSTWMSEVRTLSNAITPSTRIYSDMITLRSFEFFLGYPNQTSWIDFEKIESSEEMPAGSFVLVNQAYIAWLNKNGGMWLNKKAAYKKHEFYEYSPPSWKRRYENGNTVLYEVS
jgi:4-amino-4-deoxy-L-arabinose transferase-like glycosyltransferase